MMDFSEALKEVKNGKMIARSGWNGKGMFVTLQLTPPTTSFSHGEKSYSFLPYLQMKTADDKVVPWLASQTDILAEDWNVL
jgi:hypothetical protein